MPKSIEQLLIQAKIHSYMCAASTVKDLKCILFLNISVESYLGTTEIIVRKVFKSKSANTQAAAAIISTEFFFLSTHRLETKARIMNSNEYVISLVNSLILRYSGGTS